MRTRPPLAFCLAAVLLLTAADSRDDSRPDTAHDDQRAPGARRGPAA
ncbi:hypothetical protein [Streptomyces sp. NPDC057694]